MQRCRALKYLPIAGRRKRIAMGAVVFWSREDTRVFPDRLVIAGHEAAQLRHVSRAQLIARAT